MCIRFVLIVTVMLAGGARSFAGWEEGLFAFQTQDYATAETEFRTLVRQDPKAYRPYYMLGLTLRQVGQEAEGLEHLRKAYQLNPSDLKVKMALALAYYSAGEYRDVLALLGALEVALLPAQSHSAILQIRGMARENTGDVNGALQDFMKLAATQPEDAGIQYFYGAKAVAAGRLDAGIFALEKAMRLDPEDSAKARLYALSLIKRGRVVGDDAAMKQDYLRAAEVAAKLVAADPSHANLMLKSSAELGAGEYNKAIETSQAAISSKPDAWLAHFYLGQAYARARQYTDAEEPLRSALDRADPEEHSVIWNELGLVYEKQKKTAESAEAYRLAKGSSSPARTQSEVEDDRATEEIEARKQRLNDMKREAKQLEDELKKLEGRKD
jgi:tetratricopeptide (TPR) repeat protein